MDNQYNPLEIEKNIHQLWESSQAFSVAEDLSKEKFYCLSMFPYPSGTLHMGHVRNYTLSDVIARYQRALGKNVLNPIGWDAFGLPAENAAIEHKVSPDVWTKKNITSMQQQFKSLGYAYDWKREIATSDPNYYRWEQWLFTKLLEKGLVYKKNAKVNWDPVDQTVLANEQVVDGKGWRSGAVVEQKEISSWFLKITAYADQLLEDLDQLSEWPKQVLTMQENWIGRSHGINTLFPLENSKHSLKVFTTRIDTIFGVTHLFIAPDHPMAKDLAQKDEAIAKFIKETKQVKISEVELETLEKKGIDTKVFAFHPISKEKIPVWIANYVIMEYGTGVIMSVPGHCKRDWEMAKQYNLPVKQVITPLTGSNNVIEQADEEYGRLINSEQFDNLTSKEAITKISEFLVENKLGETKTNYRIRDWGISRQRYWGTPIPIINCDQCGAVAVPEENLPVVLPLDVKFDGATSPLKDIPEFYEAKCPKCDGDATRETDTFDTFINSSWYYARFASYNQHNAMLDNRAKYWSPVDHYIGGIEHAVLHLLYARFIHKIMRDVGLLNFDEPFIKLLTLGMVHNQGTKMSKSKGNSISPIELIEKYGADTVRLYMIFAAPPEQALDWVESGVEGSYRFLKKLWLFSKGNDALEIYNETNVTTVKTHIYWESATISQKEARREVYCIFKQINYDFKRTQFNTVVSGAMKLLNLITKLYADKSDLIDKFIVHEGYVLLLKSLAPICPHITQQLWSELGNEDLLMNAPWPHIPKDALKSESIEYVVQINGKLRGKITVNVNESIQSIEQKVIKEEFVKKSINDQMLKKAIILPDRKLINLVYIDK